MKYECMIQNVILHNCTYDLEEMSTLYKPYRGDNLGKYFIYK